MTPIILGALLVIIVPAIPTNRCRNSFHAPCAPLCDLPSIYYDDTWKRFVPIRHLLKCAMLALRLLICTSFLSYRAVSLMLDSPQALNVYANSPPNGAPSGRLPGFLLPIPSNNTKSPPLSLITLASGLAATTLGSPVKYKCDLSSFGQPNLSSCYNAIQKMPDQRNLMIFEDRQTVQEGDIPLPMRYSSGLWPRVHFE